MQTHNSKMGRKKLQELQQKKLLLGPKNFVIFFPFCVGYCRKRTQQRILHKILCCSLVLDAT